MKTEKMTKTNRFGMTMVVVAAVLAALLLALAGAAREAEATFPATTARSPSPATAPPDKA